MNEELKVPATWTPDCGGKQDFDCELIALSTRYWPGREPYGENPSAHASIRIRHGAPDDQDSEVLAELHASGDSEAEVKLQVETWSQEQFQRVVCALRREFRS